MPLVVYLAAHILCSWSGCAYRIELIDFQLEKMNDAAPYARVMAAWGADTDFGVVARCPAATSLFSMALTAR